MAKSTENPLQFLDIDRVFISKTNPRKNIDQEALKELTESIKQKGVLQPILVRPIPDSFDAKMNQLYDLVCGERRYRASQLAELKTIPANIRELSDDEAFELQIIENLERKDVHPLDEAEAFNKLLSSGKYDIPSIAAKMAKPESFIAQRLKLVDLDDALKVDFYNGHFGIGHAVLIARLSAEEQLEIKSNASSGWNSSIDNPDYGTVSQLKEDIEESTNKMDEAPFPLDKKDLVKGVCACDVCPKRTKANPILFSDMQDSDVCMDTPCYNNKVNAFVEKEVSTIINENLEVMILSSEYYKPSEIILQLCDQFDIKISKQYNDFNVHHRENWETAKGFWVSGNNIGQYDEVYLNPKTQSDSKTTSNNETSAIKESISKIEARAKRALELDAEKIWTFVRTIENTKFKDNTDALSNNEKIALIVALHSQCWQLRDDLDFVKELTIEKILTEALPDQLLNLAIRHFIAHTLNTSYGSHETSNSAAALKQVLEEYYPDEIKTIESEQLEKAEKRIERTNKKLEDLKAKLPTKKPIKKTAKA